MMEDQQIATYLNKNGIRPLRKRVKIMKYLVSKRNHPTVDMIYSDLLHEVKGLSKTTVYNVLNLFVESRVALSLNIEGNELRYDADTSVHGHFKCRKCAGVIDFRIDENDLPRTNLIGFVIDEYHYYIMGICSFCHTKMDN